MRDMTVERFFYGVDFCGEFSLAIIPYIYEKQGVPVDAEHCTASENTPRQL